MRNKFVLWGGRRHQVMEIDKNLDMAKIARVVDGEVDHSDFWWVRLSVLKELPE